MSYYTYFLYSAELNKYYIGYTADKINERLRKHNSNHKGFAGGVGDWKIMYFNNFDSENATRAIEKQIKKMKSRKMIEKLIATYSSYGSDPLD